MQHTASGLILCEGVMVGAFPLFPEQHTVVTAHVGIYHYVAITGVLGYHKFPAVLRKEDVSENTYVVLPGVFDGLLKSFWIFMGTTNRLSALQGEGGRTQ